MTDFAPLDPDAYKHAAMLLKAQHCCHPVCHGGKAGFLQDFASRLAGGRVEVEVYLTGNPEPIPANEIKLQEQPK